MKLIVIAGATATGKTHLGVSLAHALNSEIVSADSRQVYRGLDIGSGKDLAEYSALDHPIPYHLIDIVDLSENYSLFRYQQDCYRVFEDFAARNPHSPLVMVGGTGLYIVAVLNQYQIPDVPQNPPLREKLMHVDRDILLADLKTKSPELYQDSDLSTKDRVIRALEIAEFTKGGPIPYAKPPAFDIDYQVYLMKIDRKELHRRIDQRLDERLNLGMVDEVQNLLDSGISPERLKKLGLEYAQVTDYLLGHKSYQAMATDLKHAIHNFAKRQETWFRGFERKRGIKTKWIEPNAVSELIEESQRFAQTPSKRDKTE